MVLFETDKAQFLSLSVTSDTKFDVYLDSLKKINVLHGKVVKPNYTYTKVIGKNIYIAYKYKAMVIMRPFDTTENIKFNESALDNVFSGKESKFIQSKAIQTLYDKKAHVIWYHKHLLANKKTPIVFANGINLANEQIQVFSVFENNEKLNSLSQFYCSKFTGSNLNDAKYLDFGTRANELANSSQNSNIQSQQTSSYYLNSLFKGMYDYLKILK